MGRNYQRVMILDVGAFAATKVINDHRVPENFQLSCSLRVIVAPSTHDTRRAEAGLVGGLRLRTLVLFQRTTTRVQQRMNFMRVLHGLRTPYVRNAKR